MTPLTTIGCAELVNFPHFNLSAIPARIDTGAKTSSMFASNISEHNGKLSFTLFTPGHENYTGEIIQSKQFDRRVVASSNGIADERYVVNLVIVIANRKIRARFSLANRQSQVYPVLVGRNILYKKFIVDVSQGTPMVDKELKRHKYLQGQLNKRKPVS